MRDKLSKLKSLIKKYGFITTVKKVMNYILSKLANILNSINVFRNKKVSKMLESILQNNQYDRVIIWRSNFGWNVPLFQRPQHISLNLSKQKCLVFYEITHFTDKIKDLKELNENLVLVNLENKSIQKILFSKLNSNEYKRKV